MQKLKDKKPTVLIFIGQVDSLKGKNITRIAAGDGFSVFARYRVIELIFLSVFSSFQTKENFMLQIVCIY